MRPEAWLLGLAGVAEGVGLIAYSSYRWRRWLWAGQAGTIAALLSVGLLLGSLILRGMGGAWPGRGWTANLPLLAAATLIIHLWLEWRVESRELGHVTLFLGLLLTWPAVLAPASQVAISPLLEAAWRQPWFIAYQGLFSSGSGALVVATAALLQRLGRILKVASGRPPSALGAEQSERLLVRALALAYPWLTAALLVGFWWRYIVWGQTWQWTFAEGWSFVAWLAAIAAAQAIRRGWRGWPLTLATLIGSGAALLAFVAPHA